MFLSADHENFSLSGMILQRTLLFLVVFFLPHAHGRTWTDVEGRTVDAELLEITDDGVLVKRDTDGQEFTIPFARLSAADRTYLADRKTKGATDDGGSAVGSTRKAASDIPSNLDNPWPDEVSIDPQFAVTTPAKTDNEYENSELTPFIYHSPHYEFVCDVELSTALVTKFAVIFETVFASMRELPLYNRPAMGEATKRLPIILCETEEAYLRNGGPPGSAGVYFGRTNTVLVPLTSLGVKRVGSGYMLDRKVSNSTLPHELVHQLTDHNYYVPGVLGWFTEGLAEYIAVSPMTTGRYNFRSNLDEIEEYVVEYDFKAQSGRYLGEDITAPNLETFMTQSYRSFAGGNANFNYGFGLLLTAYFIHLDNDGDRTALNQFLAAAHAEKPAEEILAALRSGRSWNQLEEDIAAGWRSKGVKITFR